MKRSFPHMLRWSLGLSMLLFGLAAVPTAWAQKAGMTKAQYHDYLVRSGQIQAKTLNAGPTLMTNSASPTDLKLSVLDIGNVRARIRNSGTLGYDRDLLCYEFPFNSGVTYRWTLGPLIVGTINGTKYASSATRGAARGTSDDEFEPLAGYDANITDLAENIGIAFSDKPASWPSSWPTIESMRSQNGGHVLSEAAEAAFRANPNFDLTATGTAAIGSSGFPGALGGEVRAPREAYFVITDNDPNGDAAPAPMNVRVDVWAMQWDDFVNRNFIIYRMLFTNIGDQTIEDVYVGIHDDPDAPEQGSNEWTDDYAYLVPPGKDTDGDGTPDPDADPRSDVDNDGVYTSADSLLWNTVYLWDGDDQSAGVLSSDVGWIGLKFLETPANSETGQPRGVTSLDIFQYSAAPQTDAAAYDQMKGDLHMGLPENDPQQGGASPIMQPNWGPDGAPDDVFSIPNSYGPDVTIVAGSGPYTLAPGESLPFTFASVHGSSQADILNNAQLTQILFNANYRAASGPPTPRVEAVPSDGQVTLYWDDTAELGVYPDGTVGDPLTGNNAFEGYKIFRSDDGGQTWGRAIVDTYGTTQGFIPMATFDIPNGTAGESTTRRYFDLGTDSGLRHRFVDTNVQNGRQYLYAVVAYDRQDGPVPPLETPINAANPDAPGDNTVRAIPMAPPAGTVSGRADRSAEKVAGNSDISAFDVEVVDPTALVSGVYQITFAFDEEGAIGYTVMRGSDIVNDMSGNPVAGIGLYDPETDYAPTFNGVRVIAENVAYGIKDTEQTGSGTLETSDLVPTSAYYGAGGTPSNLTANYEVRFGDETFTYTDWDNGTPITGNFAVYKISSDGTETQITAEIYDNSSGGNANGAWDPGEYIVIVDSPYQGTGGWEGAWPGDYPLHLQFSAESTPASGDTFTIITNKALTEDDVFEFEVTAPEVTQEQLEEDLENITVVPNPFVVSSVFEQGRFKVQREVQFHGLPERCSIRIFTTAGELVQVLEHDGGAIEPWNLQTYNGQEVAFGVYLYIVQTPDGDEETGKFALIK